MSDIINQFKKASEIFEIRDKNDTHFANVYYRPSKDNKKINTLGLAGHAGHFLEYSQNTVFETAYDMGASNIAIESLDVHLDNNHPNKNPERMKYSFLENALKYSVSDKRVQKLFENSKINIMHPHSMGCLALINTVQKDNEAGAFLKDAITHTVLMNPYFYTAQKVLRSKQIFKSLDESRWVECKNNTAPTGRIIFGMEFPYILRAGNFDIEEYMPNDWRDAFSDYTKFKSDFIDIKPNDNVESLFDNNRNVVRAVKKTFDKLNASAIITSNDLYHNDLFNRALLLNAIPDNTKVIEGPSVKNKTDNLKLQMQNHTFENVSSVFTGIITQYLSRVLGH